MLGPGIAACLTPMRGDRQELHGYLAYGHVFAYAVECLSSIYYIYGDLS